MYLKASLISYSGVAECTLTTAKGADRGDRRIEIGTGVLMAETSNYELIHPGFKQLKLVNEAIAESVFSHERSGLAVYLDLEVNALATIAKHLEISSEDVVDHLKRCVRDLSFRNDRVTLQRFSRAADFWRKGSLLDTPPFLALLAIASLAAERMSNDDNFAANAYYPRLASELGIPERSEEVAVAYRSVCDQLWAGLVDWLNAWEGERGLPTVTASTQFPYVSKALSQALLREADREKFPYLFATYGLEPQQDLPVEDMAEFMNVWVPSHATAHLKALWRKQDLRKDIAEAACAELRTWTGMATEEGNASFLTRLIAVVKRSFGRKLELNLEVLHPKSWQQTDLRIELANGQSTEVPFVPTGSRTLRLADSTVLSPGDLLGGRILLTDDDLALKSLRLPRTVVPLRLDETSRLFVECDRVVLGVPHLLLVRQEVGDVTMKHPIARQVHNALSSAARPGWAELTEMDGLPAGWTMFIDVELLGEPSGLSTSNFALRALQPLSASTSIAFSGGLQVPGAVRRWSAQRLPDITAITDAPDGLGISITDSNGIQVQASSSHESAMIIELPENSLAEGEYTIKLKTSNATRTANVRLVSANQPAPRPVKTLSYKPTAGLGSLSAGPHQTDDASAIRGGLCSWHPSQTTVELSVPTETWWLNVPREALDPAPELPYLEVPEPDIASCSITGAHHIVNLPVWTGRISSNFIRGTCKTCGIVRQYPTRPGGASKAKTLEGRSKPVVAARTLNLASIPAVNQGFAELWNPILDCLSYLRSGSAAELERLAVQVEGSALSTDRLARGLESLGHLDVALDPETLRPATWSISPSAVTQLNADTAALTGARPSLLLGRPLTKVAEDYDVWIEIVENEQLPSSVLLKSTAEIDWSDFARELADQADRQVLFAPDAPLRIAAGLPVVSSLREYLPRRTLPPYRKIERWDHNITKWIPADEATQPGGYRLTGFGTIYVLRTGEDVDEGRASVCTVQLLKHIVAQETQQPLYAYYESEQALTVRLGADLPGLYGRAAVLASGCAPIEDTRQRCLIYRSVSPEIASLIHGALSQ